MIIFKHNDLEKTGNTNLNTELHKGSKYNHHMKKLYTTKNTTSNTKKRTHNTQSFNHDGEPQKQQQPTTKQSHNIRKQQEAKHSPKAAKRNQKALTSYKGPHTMA